MIRSTNTTGSAHHHVSIMLISGVTTTLEPDVIRPHTNQRFDETLLFRGVESNNGIGVDREL
jgi:hypothetical protein